MADTVSVEFESPSGDEVRFEWELDALRDFDPAAADPPAWRLSGELDWDEVELVRVLTARFEDGRMLAVAALRPAGAAGHGEEGVAGALIDADGGVEQLDEVLISTEADGAGVLQRVGLELYQPDAGMPMRVAGEPTARSSHVDGRLEHEHAALELRAHGVGGVGALELLRAR